jgi:hypothetical protein
MLQRIQRHLSGVFPLYSSDIAPTMGKFPQQTRLLDSASPSTIFYDNFISPQSLAETGLTESAYTMTKSKSLICIRYDDGNHQNRHPLVDNGRERGGTETTVNPVSPAGAELAGFSLYARI